MDNKSLNEVDTIILGAGISGLTLGYYLNNRDKDFLIFESSKNVGGNISTRNKKGFICENGPNTVLINNESVRDLISDLKIKNDVLYPNKNNNKTNTHVWYEIGRDQSCRGLSATIRTRILRSLILQWSCGSRTPGTALYSPVSKTVKKTS